MKKLIVLSALALSMASAFADNFTWVELAHTDDRTNVFSVAKEVTRIDKTDQNEQVVVTLGKAIIDGKINTFQWYVKIEDCRRKYGNLAYLDLKGKWLADGDFAFGNETLNTAVAQGLCDWALDVGLKTIKPSIKSKPAKGV